MSNKPQKKRRLTIAKSMSETIAQQMRNNPEVFVMGEDIGALGGVFGTTLGLSDEFGTERIRDTPISETAFIGAAVGAATQGMRPIVELMFVDFFGVCMDAIYNLAAKNAYFSGGKQACPMVLMTAVGGGYSDGGQHSQCLHGTFAHLPGMKVVCPSNAYDAKGLLNAAIEDNNPVVFMYHKGLQGMGWLGTEPGSVTHVPTETYTVPIGKAECVRKGSDITIVAIGIGVHQSLAAAAELETDGIFAEVLDLRSIVPLDRDAIFESVKSTGRLLVVDEDYSSFGLSGEVMASVVEREVSVFKAPPVRVAYPDIPNPFTPPMEQFALPNVAKIVTASKAMFEQK